MTLKINETILDQLVDVRTASMMLNVSEVEVRRRCMDGRLKAKKFNGTWVILKNEITVMPLLRSEALGRQG